MMQENQKNITLQQRLIGVLHSQVKKVKYINMVPIVYKQKIRY